jgi:hypothetical protein
MYLQSKLTIDLQICLLHTHTTQPKEGARDRSVCRNCIEELSFESAHQDFE